MLPYEVSVVGSPFDTVFCDIVGQLTECVDMVNMFIFKIIDTCTYYAIAISLKRHTGEDIAEAIIFLDILSNTFIEIN